MSDEEWPPGLEIVIVAPPFPLGMVAATQGPLQALKRAGESGVDFISRHASGDWGDLDDDDKASNDYDLRHGGRLLSAYYLKDQTKIWIITEYDRSATTILLPSEY